MIIHSIMFYIGCLLVIYDNVKLNRTIIALCCLLLYFSILADYLLNVPIILSITMEIYIVMSVILKFKNNRIKEDINEKENIDISNNSSNE